MSGAGRLIGVVGPSGVGKDSVMQAVALARPDVGLVRRVITRPEEAGGEDFEGVAEAAFEARVQAGDFALHWQAHGLRYGIPGAIAQDLDRGRTLLVNLSRAVLAQAQARFSNFAVLELSAAPEVLAQRLAARGRESAEDIARRLQRADYALPEGLARVVTIDNGGALDKTVAQVLTALLPDMTQTMTTDKTGAADRPETIEVTE
ncbi:phosphonate metabolism protein/1,5-bisphosphokinase (PRPP-forming) PhnN [Pseudooceanicola nitratireducens]|jgi:ribose 1,5-bisphosphokinase|uniref:phosphonate metabolism protein/1,5-bisphosphokinase (PRPP-forming) PhnN n=1 Tax=Pseudooceanicola nitratireducens TaxID=517719 RepID=UPI0035197AB1